jgi:Ulp1 family protease
MGLTINKFLQIISFYVALVQERRPDFFVFNSHFYSKLFDFNKRRQYEFEHVSLWTRTRLPLLPSIKIIMIPVNVPGHWILILIFMEHKIIVSLDSLSGNNDLEVFNIFKWLMGEWNQHCEVK